ncbi:MAG: 16S rRNA (uracil(1498)-N(3))-methyltransferase [Gammaproteobacteria bacterium]|nr:16S rRNA (uracil(1498)-N(3))-methyltransferase [Gammaproteobacteria bacterium]
MSESRIYQAGPLALNMTVDLAEAASHHLARVLRAKISDQLIVFNGEGGEYNATIIHIDKKKVTIKIDSYDAREAESPISLCLAQGISRGEKMDYTIQKAVELGVTKIIPLLTERCTVKLDADRREKKLQHWQSIIISACEQSGRNKIPTLLPPQTFSHWLPSATADKCFVLAPTAKQKLEKISLINNAEVMLLIGPEGGLSDGEIARASEQGFLPLNLGPRILRTETAAVAALTALQCIYGDLAR